MTTKVLWVSRHEMTSEQLADLRRIYGNVSVTKLDKTIQSAETQYQFVHKCWVRYKEVKIDTEIL